MKKIIYTLLFCSTFFIHAQIDRSKQPQPGPAPEINLGTPQTFTLRNGLKVLVVENHKLPRVSFNLTIDNPPILERNKAGVSALVGSLLGKGSQKITKDDFYEEVDYLGAFINFSSQGAFARGLSKYTNRIIELMADAALHPNFTQEEFDKEKKILLDNLKAQEKSVATVARRVERVLAYGKNHPYGEYTTPESVNNVTLSDVEIFYANYFVPGKAYLVVVGDVNFEEIKEQITKNFELWKKSFPPTYSLAKPIEAYYTQVNFVDMPNAVQSEIAVQNLVDLKMTDSDYFPALLANKILGGGSEARLFLNLREDKGYTYGAYSGISTDKYAPSRFRAAASVRNAVTDSAVVAFLSEINRIGSESVSSEELANAKAKYTGDFVLALERPETVARYALNIQTENLPDNFYQTYLEKINAVTAAQIQKAAKKYFKAKNLRIVVTGKGSEVLENLEKVSFNGKKIPIKYFDKYGNKAEKPKYEAVSEDITVATVLNNYLNAIGGKEKIDNVSSLLIKYEGNAMGSTIRNEERRVSDKYASTTYMNDTPFMSVVATKAEIFMKQGENKIPLPAEMLKDLENAIGIFPEQKILADNKAKLAGIEEIDGRKAYKIEVSGTAVSFTYFYDVETGLKVKEVQVTNVGGRTQTQESILKDYQEVEGIKFPSVKIGTMGPQTVEFKLKEVIINKGVSEEDFN